MDGDFKTISLSDFKGKYVVLFFCEALLLALPAAADWVLARWRSRRAALPWLPAALWWQERDS